nr:TMV resistance protein N-like [Ipomoea batatas]
MFGSSELSQTSTYGVLSHLFNLKSIQMNFCKNQEVLQQLPHTVEWLYLYHCDNLKMIQELPLNLGSIFLGSCKSLKMLPILPPDLENIFLDGCESLEMLPELPLNLERIRTIEFRGVPHTDFSESIKEVLIRSMNFNDSFDCSLTYNEIPDWIRCQKERSSISFQYPSSNLNNYTLEFYGFVFWVVFNPAPLLPPLYCHYDIRIEKHDSKAFPPTWYNHHGIQLEVEGISFLHVITANDLYDYYGCGDIKAGEVIKATPIIEIYEGLYRDGNRSSFGEANLVKKIGVKASVVKKIGIEALYIDKDGSLQLLPLTKVG